MPRIIRHSCCASEGLSGVRAVLTEEEIVGRIHFTPFSVRSDLMATKPEGKAIHTAITKAKRWAEGMVVKH